MKRIYLSALMACLACGSFAQSQWYHYTEEFYFVKEVSVEAYRGKQFRYEIAVNEKPSDTLSRVRIHGINVGKGKDAFINSQFDLETRKEQDWTVYTVAGRVDDHASRLWFYSAVNGNGQFYFDDISFYIELSPGQWKQLVLPNTSFESRSSNIFDGYYVSKRAAPGLRTRVSNQVYKTGSRSLEVISSSQQPVSVLTTALEEE